MDTNEQNTASPMTPAPNERDAVSYDDMQEVAADVRSLIASAPESIWLDIGEALEALTDDGKFRDLQEVTWSEDNATGVGIKYVRSDVHEHEIIARFLKRTGQYVTNDASREAVIAEAIRASASSSTVPEGFVLVPIEPTEAMHQAAVRTIVQCSGNADFPPRVYRAMLAAAPQPPESK